MPEPEPEPMPEPEPEMDGIGVEIEGYLNSNSNINYVKVDAGRFYYHFNDVIDNSNQFENIVTFSARHISSENTIDISTALIKSLSDTEYYYIREHPVSNIANKKLKANDYLVPLN